MSSIVATNSSDGGDGEESPPPPATLGLPCKVRPLSAEDLPAADRVMRLAFGTFLGMPDPSQFMGDAAYVQSRFRYTRHFGAFNDDSRLVGSVFATVWGSFGFFGPLTVEPAAQGRGIAQTLLAEVERFFDGVDGLRRRGLSTFAHSTLHVHLYMKFGYVARFLVAVTSKELESGRSKESGVPQESGGSKGASDCPPYRLLSAQTTSERARTRQAASALASSAVFAGLDHGVEFDAVLDLSLGDVVLLFSGSSLLAYAVVHSGAGSEAGSKTAYVKVAVACDGKSFRGLLAACETYAASSLVKARKLLAGVNVGRTAAFAVMREREYRAVMQGVAMEKACEAGQAGFDNDDVFVCDDWR